MTAFTADNERVLQRAGLPVNDATRYALHFLGRSGGPRFVAGFLRDPNAPASAYANADQVRANRTVFFNLIAQDGGYRRLNRQLFWMRDGYVEEVYARR